MWPLAFPPAPTNATFTWLIVWLLTTRQQTTRPLTTGLQDHGTTGLRDYGLRTTGLRDYGPDYGITDYGLRTTDYALRARRLIPGRRRP
ncbi:MAG: hypothetical protein FJ272_16045 [Planctomycetes bacterium]|nr:hypothetical protein [Planctomycetota bacterium]